MVLISCLHCSQTNPAPGNHAANGLSEEGQLRNIRKVQVNAQVTFAIYVLETLALVSVVVVWFMIRKNEISMTISFIAFYVMLPYTFLMNTDYNKNLITEYGFFNTIRNALRFPCYVKASKENQTRPEKKLEEHQEVKESTGPLSASETRVKEIRISLEDKLNYSSIQSPDIFIVSRSEKNAQWSPWNDNDVFDFTQDPCCSNSISHVSNQERCSTSDERNTSITDEETSTSPINRHLYLAETILSKMVANVNNEKNYIHYLKELVRLEKVKDQNEDELRNFEVAIVNKCQVPKLGKTDTSDAQMDNEEVILPSTISPYDAFDYTDAPNVNFLGRFLDRLELRKGILTNIQINCMNAGSYEEMFNALMDLEEGLVM